MTGGFTLATDGSSCTCPVRYVANPTTFLCEACPYDCYSCDTSRLCLTCNGTTDFRTLKNSTGRCVAMVGYYDANVTICPKCHSSCVVCNSSAQCTPCPVRTYRSSSTYNCEACPFDCYTCDMFTLLCLTCNGTTDFRTLNSTSGRCEPLPNYYESNTTVAAQCPSQCTRCSSATNCSSCVERYYHNSGTCAACHYSCLSCDGTGCLSCSLNVDFRSLVGSNCNPILGYF